MVKHENPRQSNGGVRWRIYRSANSSIRKWAEKRSEVAHSHNDSFLHRKRHTASAEARGDTAEWQLTRNLVPPRQIRVHGVKWRD